MEDFDFTNLIIAGIVLVCIILVAIFFKLRNSKNIKRDATVLIIGLLIISGVIYFAVSGDKNDKPVSKTEIKKEQIAYQIPEYGVLEKIKRIDGNIHASVIIKSFTQKTPLEQREKAARAIAKKIGTTILDLYCTKEAFKANYSSSYLKKHPNALKKGYLGVFKNNKFKL